MTPSWEALTALGTILASAVGFGVAHGKLRQKVNDMNKQIVVNTAKIGDYDKRLNEGDSSAKVILVKMDNLLDNQSDMKQQIKEMDDRLRRHCESDK